MKLSTELGFDSEAAFKKATYYAEKYGAGYNSFEIIYAFKAGAFWQHLQDNAALSAMKSELDVLKLEKSINYEGIEMYFESRIETLRGEKFELKIEIEKLRAEKANDWKRMDEAKDAFACTVDQLNAAVDQQAIEIDKLRETLSAMNSLATKYRNNCDMLMQYRGVFKDEIEKLRADRAILVRCFEFLVESSQISIFSTEKGSEAFKLYEKLKRDAE